MSFRPEIPGKPTQTGTALLETATAAIQGFGPVSKIHQHLCAFHFYGHDMNRQVEAHHFCGHQNEEMRQCLIYDSPEPDARLIGLEYIVSENLFLTLPDEEKRLWHSHEYEVKSGVLFMPGIPGPTERKDLEKVCKTYGKVYHFWQVDKGDNLPFGLPQVMMALTRDGQIYENLVEGMCLDCLLSLFPFYFTTNKNKARVNFTVNINSVQVKSDGIKILIIRKTIINKISLIDDVVNISNDDVEKRYGVSFNKERQNRAYMSGPEHGIHPLANGGGKGLQTVLRETDCKPIGSVARVFV